jgi:GntR family transcriptional repressor for pyruvate dehydrogenase complex
VLRPIARKSLSDAVFEQLRDQIVGGEIPPGNPLPAERSLCEALGVNRGAVREALRRLEQAGLVHVRHGATPRVRDFRRSAGLDLLPHLILTPNGDVDLAALRSVVEARSALAPDIARLAALRGGDETAAALREITAAMHRAAGELPTLQDLANEFWSALVDGSDNVAYRLAFNSLRAGYERSKELFTQVLVDELADAGAYAELAEAVSRRDAARAESLARELIGRGARALLSALEQARRQA